MKVKLTLLIVVFVFMFFISCEERIDAQSESIYKPAVIEFLDDLNLSNPDNAARIDALKTSIDFGSITSYQINPSLQLLITDMIPSGSSDNASVLKIVFTTNQQKIISGNIVTFEGASSSVDYNVLIAGFILRKPNHFTGKVSVYNLYEKLAFSNVYDNGRIVAHGTVGITKPKESSNSKTQICIAWYLVTTYYYAEGGTSTTSEYLYTTCDCETNTTRTSATMCGSGQGGGSSGTLPSQASDGDRVFMSYPDGRTAIYRAEVTPAGIYWQLVAVTLPSVTITASSEYSFLPVYPYHNQQVAGADGLIYEYNGDWGLWQGVLYDYNEVNRKFREQFETKYRNPMGFLPTAGMTTQEVVQQIINKLETLGVDDRLLHDSENHYNMRPLYFTVKVGTSVITVELVSSSQWTPFVDIFGNPGSLTSPTDSTPIPISTDQGNMSLTIYFQKSNVF